MRYNPIHKRRRLNSSRLDYRELNALIQEAIDLQPRYNTGSYIHKHMSDDLYYFCVKLIDRAGRFLDTHGCRVRPAFMDDFGRPTEIRDSTTDEVLVEIPLEDELDMVVSLLADGYTPDTIITELIDWYYEEANANG